MKRVLFFFLFLGTLQVLIVACCPDPVDYYLRINRIEVMHSNPQGTIADSSAYTPEDYRLTVFLNEVTEMAFTPSYDLVSSSYALSCPEDIFVGLKHSISSVSISASEEIFGIDPNTPFPTDKFKFYEFFDEGRGLSQSEWLERMNNGGFPTLTWFIGFSDTLQSEDYLRFKLNMVMSDGSTFETISEAIKFN